MGRDVSVAGGGGHDALGDLSLMAAVVVSTVGMSSGSDDHVSALFQHDCPAHFFHKCLVH